MNLGNYTACSLLPPFPKADHAPQLLLDTGANEYSGSLQRGMYSQCPILSLRASPACDELSRVEPQGRRQDRSVSPRRVPPKCLGCSLKGHFSALTN